MTASRTPARLAAGAGGAALVASLFLPWAERADSELSGWELWNTTDVLLAVAGLAALAAAVTGGRVGLFRRDLSLNGATDLLNVVATLLIAWMLLVELPDGADVQAGAIVGLIAAMAVACAVGDYSVFRGAPAFPRLGGREPGTPAGSAGPEPGRDRG